MDGNGIGIMDGNGTPRANGLRLRAVLEERGVSQQRLADAIGSTRQFVGYLVAGKQVPNLRTVYRIARALGVPPSSLIDDTVSADVLEPVIHVLP